ncbi:MAG: hypothetical protein KGI27_15530, partial [Thaumarchaeota archaeon]|nr:hypothetical protein [Nitrososphaerota archaeon]
MPKEIFKRLVEETKNLNLAIIKERESKEVRIVQIGQRISKREEQIEQLRNNTKVYLDDVISHLI